MSSQVKWLADENVNDHVITAVFRRSHSVELVRARDVGLGSRQDSEILEWAAQQGRVVLTQDINTVTAEAYRRIDAGKSMPGVVVIGWSIAVGTAVADLLVMNDRWLPEAFRDQVRFLPLR